MIFRVLGTLFRYAERIALRIWPLGLVFLARYYGDALAVYILPNDANYWQRTNEFNIREALTTVAPAALIALAWIAYRIRLGTAGTIVWAGLGVIASYGYTFWRDYEVLAPYAKSHGRSLIGVVMEFGNEYLIYSLLTLIVVIVLIGDRTSIGRLLTAAMSGDGGERFKRASTSEHGSSRFLTMKEARDFFPTGGLIVGEAYRPNTTAGPFIPADKSTWGDGGKHAVLRSDGSRGSGHCLVFAGSGGLKTVSFVVPTCLEWPGSVVVLDPSAEVAPIVKDDRERRGRRVIALNPAVPGVGFNVLGFINPADFDADLKAQNVAAWLMGLGGSAGSAGKDFFPQTAAGLLACLIADTITNPDIPPTERTLTTVRRRLATGATNLKIELSDLALTGTRFVAELASGLAGLVDETWSGVYGNADTATRWLSVDALANVVSGTSFTGADLVAGKVDVFIQLNIETLSATPAVAKLVVGALISEMVRADGRHVDRVLFVMDEVFQLGNNFAPLTVARDVGRKSGIVLALIYQSVGQIIEQFGREGRQAFYASAAFRSYAVVADQETAREVSEACGSATGQVTSTSSGSGGSLNPGQIIGSASRNTGENVSNQKFAIITESEILQEMRADEQIVIAQGSMPIRCGRAIYFRRPEWVARTARNRYHRRVS